jgi:formylglycine-generating enzyme required for sulfatase activity
VKRYRVLSSVVALVIAVAASAGANLDRVLLPYALVDSKGFVWAIQRNGSANDVEGADFYGISGLTINGVGFPGSSDAEVTSDGREIVIGTASVSGIEVARRILIPADEAYARYEEILHNPSSQPVVVTVGVHSNLGGFGSSLIVETSSGGIEPGVGDLWVVTRAGEFPAVVHVFGRPTPTEVVLADGHLHVSHVVTVPAFGGATVVHFVARRHDRGEAGSVARELAARSIEAAIEMPEDSQLSEAFALIPAGGFWMGDTLFDGHPDEQPVHWVYVSSFFMSRYEVTNDEMVEALQWAVDRRRIVVTSETIETAVGDRKKLMHLSEAQCRITWDGSRFHVKPTKGVGYPCVEVTWYGAVAYCNFRSEMEGLTPCYDLADWICDWTANGYRLPTEAEWEKAARGGVEGRRFPWSDTDTIDHTRANYDSTQDYPYDGSLTDGFHPLFEDGEYPYTSPVGSFAPNGYGLYDMAGNVCEWTWDFWSATYYSVSPEIDPRGPATGSYHVVRSSRWRSDARYCRIATRRHGWPGGRRRMGFRVALPAGM